MLCCVDVVGVIEERAFFVRVEEVDEEEGKGRSAGGKVACTCTVHTCRPKLLITPPSITDLLSEMGGKGEYVLDDLGRGHCFLVLMMMMD